MKFSCGLLVKSTEIESFSFNNSFKSRVNLFEKNSDWKERFYIQELENPRVPSQAPKHVQQIYSQE